LRSNSGSSSRNKTPKCARVISPGLGCEPLSFTKNYATI